MNPRALIRAVLAPHHAEDSELRIPRFAAKDRDNLLVFVRRELVLCDEIFGDRHRHARTATRIMEWNMVRPSLDPSRSSDARSGCGIMPMTLRSRFSTPAMSRSEPLGLSR